MRRESEKALVDGYHATLVSHLDAEPRTKDRAQTLSKDDCWREYVDGGAGRWIWFLPVLAESQSAPAAQFFHDQLAAFLKDHVLDPKDAPMPRA